jgi:hypothetical protein
VTTFFEGTKILLKTRWLGIGLGTGKQVSQQDYEKIFFHVERVMKKAGFLKCK